MSDKDLQRASDSILKVWPEYHIDSCLGRGSTGAVFKAWRKGIRGTRCSAIQYIRSDFDEWDWKALSLRRMPESNAPFSPDSVISAVEQKLNRAKAVSGHKNLVTIEDYHIQRQKGGSGCEIFLRTECLTPFEQCQSHTKPFESDCIRIGMDLCSALSVCYDNALPPESIERHQHIFYRADGNSFCLNAFSLNRILENMVSWPDLINVRYGALDRRPPEWYSGPVERSPEACCREDLYALGLMMYALLNNGRLPFMDVGPHPAMARQTALQRRIKGEPLPPPRNASPEMCMVIQRACAYRPEDRFPSAEAMFTALSECPRDVSKATSFT